MKGWGGGGVRRGVGVGGNLDFVKWTLSWSELNVGMLLSYVFVSCVGWVTYWPKSPWAVSEVSSTRVVSDPSVFLVVLVALVPQNSPPPPLSLSPLSPRSLPPPPKKKKKKNENKKTKQEEDDVDTRLKQKHSGGFTFPVGH